MKTPYTEALKDYLQAIRTLDRARKEYHRQQQALDQGVALPEPSAYPWTPDNIIALREDMGMSKTTFALKLGIDRRTIYLWETGCTFPTAKNINKLNALKEELGS
jgi:DNA-binding transcriptional regulator YiaG